VGFLGGVQVGGTDSPGGGDTACSIAASVAAQGPAAAGPGGQDLLVSLFLAGLGPTDHDQPDACETAGKRHRNIQCRLRKSSLPTVTLQPRKPGGRCGH